MVRGEWQRYILNSNSMKKYDIMHCCDPLLTTDPVQ